MRHHLFRILSRNPSSISILSATSRHRFLSSSGIILCKKVDENFKSCLDGPKVASPFINNDYQKHLNNDLSLDLLKLHENKKIPQENLTLKSDSEKPVNVQETVEIKKNIKVEENVKVKENIKVEENVETKKNVEFKKNTTESSQTADENSKNEELEEKEKSEKRKRSEKYTILSFKIFIGSALASLVGFLIYSGMEHHDDKGNIITDQYSGQTLAPLWRMLDSIKNVKKFVFEPSREKLLPDPLQYPYLQPKYTLVIEMKNVLLHPEWTYKTGYRFKKRPALDYFLDVVGYPNFEVVIYTSDGSSTAPQIIDQIDPNQKIMYRLYRDCTLYENGHNRKDLSRLNRDLSKVIYIDFDPESFKLHPENVLRVPKWEGDMSDTSLIDLAELLKTILESNVDDVRPTLQYYSQYDDPAKEFKRRAYYLAEQKAENQSKNNESTYAAIKRYSGSLFGFKRHN